MEGHRGEEDGPAGEDDHREVEVGARGCRISPGSINQRTKETHQEKGERHSSISYDSAIVAAISLLGTHCDTVTMKSTALSSTDNNNNGRLYRVG